jgi:hypothetical protein
MHLLPGLRLEKARLRVRQLRGRACPSADPSGGEAGEISRINPPGRPNRALRSADLRECGRCEGEKHARLENSHKERRQSHLARFNQPRSPRIVPNGPLRAVAVSSGSRKTGNLFFRMSENPSSSQSGSESESGSISFASLVPRLWFCGESIPIPIAIAIFRSGGVPARPPSRGPA